jgi:hypothetical protein
MRDNLEGKSDSALAAFAATRLREYDLPAKLVPQMAAEV